MTSSPDLRFGHARPALPDSISAQRALLSRVAASPQLTRGPVFHVTREQRARNAWRFDTVLSDEDIEREVVESKRLLESHTGQEAPAFVWLHGSSYGQSPRHDEAVRAAGYRYQFANTMIHRVN